MYHGVTLNEPRGIENCDGKHVHVTRFREQLAILKAYRRVLPLSELVDGVVRGEDMRNAVAITFDDGFENNLVHAADVLCEHKASATFFLATGYIGTDRWMWVDRLEFAIDRYAREELELSFMGRISTRDKRAALRQIKAHCKRLPETELQALLAEIEQRTGSDTAPPIGDYRFMSWAQVQELKSAGFEIGAHTVNHPILSRVDVARAEREMLESRDHIKKELGSCSQVFCYPNGKSSDYTPEVMQAAARHFSAALATNRGPARSSERYEMRRIGVGYETTSDDFVHMLIREQ
jgi:peptidoglycan/xylan/chitin deacetylase (PgdA/CDA1 family)